MCRADRTSRLGCESVPGVLRVDIEIEKVEGFICVRRERLRRGIRYAIDELLQVRIVTVGTVPSPKS